MAEGVAESEQGRAAGWFQAGSLGGIGAGAGAGVWLASHVNAVVATLVLAGAMLPCVAAVAFVPRAPARPHEPITGRLRAIGRAFVAMVRAPESRLITCCMLSPIGAGALLALWSAVAPSWRASADTVALVTGPLFAVAAAAGCVAGGWYADRAGRWPAYFASGVGMAAAAFAMMLAPRTPTTFVLGVTAYSLAVGLAFAAFSALALQAAGREAAASKYALLSSMGNLPVVYMLTFEGWVHDRHGPARMLLAETVVPLAAIPLVAAALARIRRAEVVVRDDTVVAGAPAAP